jgi:hypothetical protein
LKTKLNSPLDGDTDWAEVFRRLTLFAHRRLGVGADLARAEELASEAISRFLAVDRGARAQMGSLNLTHDLGSIVETLLSDHRAPCAVGDAERFRQQPPGQRAPTAQRDSDAVALSSPISLLAKGIAGDRLMEGIVLLSLEGILDASAQAVHLISPITEIYEARKRLSRVIAAIRAASQPKVSP